MTGNWFGYEGEFKTLLDDSERTFDGRKIVYENGFQGDYDAEELDEEEESL